MNRREFEWLRDLVDKRITMDIRFETHKDASPNLIFDNIVVENSSGWRILLNGTYKPHIPSITLNFVVGDAGGPICRVDVNGTIHGKAGRTHKHDLQREEDPRLNLPYAVARPDLDRKSPQEVWEIVCQQAKINHTGKFYPPERGT